MMYSFLNSMLLQHCLFYNGLTGEGEMRERPSSGTLPTLATTASGGAESPVAREKLKCSEVGHYSPRA